MPTPKVIDLSHWNTIPESLEPAADSGILGCIHKLTEGTGYVDNKAIARYVLAGEANLMWGLYHFVRPGDMEKQAQFFFDTAYQLGVADGNTLWALDWEDKGVSAEEALAFMAKIQDLTGHEPVLYSGHVCKEDPDPRLWSYRLWLAQYASQCELPKGAEEYWLWQYTQEGKVPGIDGDVDLNAYEGSDGELLAEWSGRAGPEAGPDVIVEVRHRKAVTVEVRLIEED